MKNNLKRVFSLVLVFMLCMTFIPTNTVSAKTFKDVPKTHWAYNYIDEMSNKGYIQGYPNGTFRPSKNITFLEAMRFAAILSQYDESALQAARGVWLKQVQDLGVPKWAQDNVVKCLAKGAVNMKTLQAAKKNKMFTTNKAVSRVNLAEFFAKAMAVKSTDPVIALSFKDVNDIPEGLRAYVAGLIDAGVISEKGTGKGMFYPKRAVSRDQVARMVYAALEYQAKNASNVNPVNPVTPVNPVNPVNPVTPVNPTPTVVTGTIKEIGITGVTAIMLVNDNTANGKVFSINPSTIITVDGSMGSLSSLLVGQNVTVTADSSLGAMQAKTINAKGVQFSLEGEVTNVDSSNKEIKITYTDSTKNKVSKVFKVDSDSSITINNRTRDLVDVKRGSQVKATIYNDKVKTLEVTASSDDYKGYVKSLSSREITIVSLNGRENRYRLPSRLDMDIYDSRDNYRRSYNNRSMRFEEFNSLVSSGNVYVEIETDPRYDNEVTYIEIRDGFDNEYIVYSNNYRGRDRGQNQIEVYPKGSSDSRNNRETYYYDYDLRADSFNSRKDVRVSELGAGSRVVILDKDRDVIKRIMVIDSTNNNGYYYNNNWVQARINYKKSDALGIKEYNTGREYEVKIDKDLEIRTLDYVTYYYFEIINNTVRSYSEKEPSGYRVQNGKYDRTIKIARASLGANESVILRENTIDHYGYVLDKYTIIDNNYTFEQLYGNSNILYEGRTIDINIGKNWHIDRIYIR